IAGRLFIEQIRAVGDHAAHEQRLLQPQQVHFADEFLADDRGDDLHVSGMQGRLLVGGRDANCVDRKMISPAARRTRTMRFAIAVPSAPSAGKPQSPNTRAQHKSAFAAAPRPIAIIPGCGRPIASRKNDVAMNRSCAGSDQPSISVTRPTADENSGGWPVIWSSSGAKPLSTAPKIPRPTA